MPDTTLRAPAAAEIQHRPIASLKPHARNARTHSRKQIRQIADSITRFGFTNPVLVDAEGGILAGHGRVEAARLLGLAEVPCLRIDWMSEAERRAYVLADNKLALNAGWDEDMLALELGALIEEVPELDIRLTGFTIAEVDEILDLGGTDAATERAEDDRIPPLPEGPAVTRPGDVWRLGAHRLTCGDALEEDTYARVLDAPAQMIFTDPPYNVPIQGHVTGKGRVRHREFAMAAGEMSRAEFTGFLTTVFERLAAHSIDGSIHFICMDWRHMSEILAAGEASYTEMKNLCVWMKGQGGMGSFYRSRHELVFVFKNGTAAHVNSFELGQHGRNRTNVWSYPGASSGTRAARAEQALQNRVGLQPIPRRLADPGLGRSHGNGMGLFERHEEPHLLIGDMTARHERFPTRKTVLYRCRSRPSDPPPGAQRGFGASPVGLRPPCDPPNLRSHPD